MNDFDSIPQDLAGEYVLGTLSGSERASFASQLQNDSQLQKQVVAWEERLFPLCAALPNIDPPEYVLKKLLLKIDSKQTTTNFWDSVQFWRNFGLTAATVAAALFIFTMLPVTKIQQPQGTQLVAMLNNDKSEPTWFIQYESSGKSLTIKNVRSHAITDQQAFELWMLPNGNQPPVSLGLVSKTGETKISLSEAQIKTLANSSALAISLEPKGGSPIGAPTGPVLFSGPWVSL